MIMETPDPCKFKTGDRKLLLMPAPENNMSVPRSLLDVLIVDCHRTKPMYCVTIFGTRDVMVDVPEESLLPHDLANEYVRLVAAETVRARRSAAEFLDWYRLNLDRYSDRPVESVVEAFCGRKSAPPTIFGG